MGVFEIRPILRDEHQFPLITRTTICRNAIFIEWDCNIEPKLRKVNDINVNSMDFGDCRSDIERNVLEKAA